MANPNMTQLITTTHRYFAKNLANTISKNTALMMMLRRKGSVRILPGGREIVEPIRYDEAASFLYYTGREALNLTQNDHITGAQFNWKQYAVAASIDGRTMLMNQGGQQQRISIVAQNLATAYDTITNRIGEALYSDGTGSSGKQIGGLASYVSSAAGGTVGGIDSSTATWWDNQRRATGAVSVDTIYGHMLAMQLECTRNRDKPDLIVADNTYFSAFVESQQRQQRYMDPRLANAGFANIDFLGTPVVADGNQGGFAPAGMFFLNCKSIKYNIMRGRNNVILGGPRRPLDEDSDTAIIAGMAQMSISNRMLNGRLVAAVT